MADLTGVAILSGIGLKHDSRYNPDNLFHFLEGTLNSLSTRKRLVYAEFDSSTLSRRRNPETNDTNYNIDVPRFGLTPHIGYRMVGSRTHLDVSLIRNQVGNFDPGTIGEMTSGIWWRWKSMLQPLEGIQIILKTLRDSRTKETDRRFIEFFW